MKVNFQAASFVTSAAGREGFLLDRPEILFAGRSNAGKSTLINLICSRKGLMKTSSTPGKTRLVNYVSLGKDFYLCDCPGYGFERERDYFERLMTQFFDASRKVLRGLVLVVDSRRGILSSDRDMIGFARERDIPVLAVYTKVDKLNRSQLSQALAEFRREFPEYTVVTSSSLKPAGIEEAREAVASLLTAEM